MAVPETHPRLKLGQFAGMHRGQMIPLGTRACYFCASLTLSEEDLQEYLTEPVSALPPAVSSRLPKLEIFLVPYLERGAETTGRAKAAAPEPVFSGEDALRFQALARQMPIAQNLVRHAVRLAAASRPGRKDSPAFVNDWVNWGAGTRAAQSLVLGAKARALLQGRSHAGPEDIRALAAPVLRHRILVNYRAEAEGINSEEIIRRLLESVKEPA